jgi:hypothetical protein
MCTFVPVKQVNFVPASLTYPAASSCLQVGGSEYYEQYSSIYSGAAPEMGSSRNRLSPPKDHHQPPPNGTQFTRFTGTNLQVLTQKALQPGGTPKPCPFLNFFFIFLFLHLQPGGTRMLCLQLLLRCPAAEGGVLRMARKALWRPFALRFAKWRLSLALMTLMCRS